MPNEQIPYHKGWIAISANSLTSLYTYRHSRHSLTHTLTTKHFTFHIVHCTHFRKTSCRWKPCTATMPIPKYRCDVAFSMTQNVSRWNAQYAIHGQNASDFALILTKYWEYIAERLLALHFQCAVHRSVYNSRYRWCCGWQLNADALDFVYLLQMNCAIVDVWLLIALLNLLWQSLFGSERKNIFTIPPQNPVFIESLIRLINLFHGVVMRKDVFEC